MILRKMYRFAWTLTLRHRRCIAEARGKLSVLNALTAQEWLTSAAVVVIVETSVEGVFVVAVPVVAVAVDDDVVAVAAGVAENSHSWY